MTYGRDPEIDRILDLSDEEIITEVIRDGEVPEQIAKRMRELFDDARKMVDGCGWRCFYCNEIFTKRETAEAHFGRRYAGEPACVPDKLTAKAWASRVEWAKQQAIEACAKIAENYEGTLANPATVSHCRNGIAAAIRGMLSNADIPESKRTTT